MRVGFTIFPGLSVPDGSNADLISLNAATSRLPNIGSRNSERTRPSPCSPECVPPKVRTSSCASSAMARMAPQVLVLLEIQDGPNV